MNQTWASGDRVELHVGVRSLEAMLDASGSPLTKLRLHPEIAEQLLEDVSDAPKEAEIRVCVEVATGGLDRAADAQRAVHEHFGREASAAQHAVRECMRDGWKQLVVALAVVAVLVLISEGLQQLGDGRIFRLLGESLIIVGWVTVWGPSEKLLFDHVPMRRRKRAARILSRAEVLVRERVGVCQS